MVRNRRKVLLSALGILVAALLVQIALFEISKARCYALVGEAICRVETTQRVVALTFDDGPTPEGVDAAILALREPNGRATFFLVGN